MKATHRCCVLSSSASRLAPARENSVSFLQIIRQRTGVSPISPLAARSIPPSLHSTIALRALCDRRYLVETTSLLCVTNTFLIDIANLQQQAGLRPHTPFTRTVSYTRDSVSHVSFPSPPSRAVGDVRYCADIHDLRSHQEDMPGRSGARNDVRNDVQQLNGRVRSQFLQPHRGYQSGQLLR